VRRARAARDSTHSVPHPAESPLVWCRADSVTADLTHTSLTRPCAPSRTGGPRGRAAAGERTRARHDPARDSGLGLRPGPRSTPAAAREFATRPHAERRRYERPRTPARHGVRAHLFRVSSDKLRVKRARTPYTARYVKGPRRPTLPGGRLLSHAEGTVDFFSFDQFAWSWLSVGGRRTLTRHRSSSCSRQPQRG